MKHREIRLSSLILAELNKILIREVDFGGALVTPTEVDVDKKLERAIILFSVLPSSKSEEALKILERESKHLHHLLMKKINIRRMPELMFRIDLGPEKAARIEKALMESELPETEEDK